MNFLSILALKDKGKERCLRYGSGQEEYSLEPSSGSQEANPSLIDHFSRPPFLEVVIYLLKGVCGVGREEVSLLL